MGMTRRARDLRDLGLVALGLLAFAFGWRLVLWLLPTGR